MAQGKNQNPSPDPLALSADAQPDAAKRKSGGTSWLLWLMHPTAVQQPKTNPRPEAGGEGRGCTHGQTMSAPSPGPCQGPEERIPFQSTSASHPGGISASLGRRVGDPGAPPRERARGLLNSCHLQSTPLSQRLCFGCAFIK